MQENVLSKEEDIPIHRFGLSRTAHNDGISGARVETMAARQLLQQLPLLYFRDDQARL